MTLPIIWLAQQRVINLNNALLDVTGQRLPDEDKLANVIELIKQGANINAVGSSNETTLYNAIYTDSPKTVEYLINHGVRLAWDTEMPSMSATNIKSFIGFAAMHGKYNSLRVLLGTDKISAEDKKLAINHVAKCRYDVRPFARNRL